MAKKQKSSSDQHQNHSPQSEDASSDDQFVQQPSKIPQSDSGSESDSDTTPPPHSTSKSIISKPIDVSSLKRPANENDSRRVKKKGAYESEEEAKKAVVDSRKMFQRLWSEEDEIAILKGMVEFTSKTGKDPYKYAEAFYEFVKKSLHVEASSNQLKEKIRRLKKKFENNAQRGKNGEDPNFSKQFDRETFELSKKVWGNAGSGGVENVVKGKSDKKVVETPKKELARSTDVAPSKPKPELKLESRLVDLNKDVKMDIDVVTDTSSYLMEVFRVNKGVGLGGLNEEVVKRGLELIGASERKELEEEWKELQAAEFELSVKRVELIANHARLILEAYKSSNH
ncbi:PREDICTED: GLABROUS1 enhancer-binding protein-like isoform X2 [Lupinus angustifolius]|uniref:GLABROUS1 enhancer-binding protein-like isoform X2 n=1 Tax=Lupinus angustifolius TaxID=3871 RepID=UPI00092EBA58|nr:PREDICTED: GLABROUS1 enhancer-binding protein-like isoform X2 [Lupinus angustifolius]